MSRNVSVVITDDITGEPEARRVTFALDSKSYEIDLTEDNITALRAALAPWVAAARSLRPAGEVPAPRLRPDAAGPSAAEVRAWARSTGLAVPERGRLSDELRSQYSAAH